MYQASWAVIKWGEDSQVMIVTKVVNKNLFSQPFSENLWTAGSNSVPILSAAMGIFFKIGHWTWIPTFERVRSPASLSSEAGNLSRIGCEKQNLIWKQLQVARIQVMETQVEQMKIEARRKLIEQVESTHLACIWLVEAIIVISARSIEVMHSWRCWRRDTRQRWNL